MRIIVAPKYERFFVGAKIIILVSWSSTINTMSRRTYYRREPATEGYCRFSRNNRVTPSIAWGLPTAPLGISEL